MSGGGSGRDSARDVVIVGGGIVGTAAAMFLAEGGARVTLIEREGLASGASGANSGVVQHPFDPVLAALYRETVALYRELSAADVGFRLATEPAGLLYVSADEAAVRHVDASLAGRFPDLDRCVAFGPELQRIEPAVAPELWACRVGIGFPVQPGASTYAYATLAERLGVVMRTGRSAILDQRGDAIRGVIVDGQSIPADAVLVAAGPWSPKLIDPSGRWAPIGHRWGVVVETEMAAGPSHVLEEAEIGAVIGTALEAVIDDRPQDEALDDRRQDDRPQGDRRQDDRRQGEALDDRRLEDRPQGDRRQDDRRQGEALDDRRLEDRPLAFDPDEALEDFSLVPLGGVAAVGSTFLAREPDPAAWVERLLVRASQFVPGVAEAPIRGVRACARPQSLDGRPLIGGVPGRRGLFICAGHGSWGISTGPGSARLIADQILGRAPQISTALDPARFGEI